MKIHLTLKRVEAPESEEVYWGGAPVLEVLVRVGVPVWDHRGTPELVVAICGSPLSPR